MQKLTKTAFTIIFFSFFADAGAQDMQKLPADTLAENVRALQTDVGFLKKIKISGLIQAQFQVADSVGIKSASGGDFPAGVDKRFKVRRGEFKTAFDNGKTLVFANIDVTQDGIKIKDAYGRFTEQWLKAFSLTVGIFKVPFGYEGPLSSAELGSPERARIIQTMLPGERDCGAMLTFQMQKSSKLNPLKIEGGIFNGTGNSANDFDYQKDFSGNIHWGTTAMSEKISYSIGVSYYKGEVKNGTKNVYSTVSDSLGLAAYLLDNDTMNYAAISNREYIGGDAQLTVNFPFGKTTIKAEYMQGTQPGTASTSKSPDAQPTTDTYMRNFNGAYLLLMQSIWKTKHELIVKYDWYDPNTNVAGNDIGKTVNAPSGKTFAKTNKQDIAYTTLAVGWIYNWDNNVRLLAYYDMLTNETSSNLSGFTKDLKDNVLTLRVQYKF